MSRTEKHHYVPVWYLKRFTASSSKYLYLYDLEKKEIRKQKPEKILKIRNYYSQPWAPAGTDMNALEKQLANTIEPKGMVALDKLTNDPGSLNNDDIAAMFHYIEFQRIRVPRQAKENEKLLETYLKKFALKVPNVGEALESGIVELSIQDSARFMVMKTIAGVIVSYFPHMKWDVVFALEGVSFITTDSPVSFYNPKIAPQKKPA